MRSNLAKLCAASLVLLSSLGAALSRADSDQPLGIHATDTYELLQKQGEQVLFIDVRDPVEIMFTGFTDSVDANIPFLLVDRNQWNADKSRFAMVRNPHFVDAVERALQARGLKRDSTIITMCRSGSGRGQPSARLLREQGFSDARYVIHGFQGDRAARGEQKGMRVVNGWQNSGLPWSGQLNGEKRYQPPNESTGTDGGP